MKKDKVKKEKWTKFRHRMVFALLRFVFKILFFFKFKFKCKKQKLPKEGALILCNHTMAFDPFIIGAKFNRPIYFMCTKDLFQNKFVGKIVKFLVNPIPKEKGNKNDLACIKDCMKVSKENGTICIFPEGNRTFTGKLGNVDNSIVKLAKLLKKPLIICNIVGGYSSDPRWSHKRRKGKLEIIIRKELQYDEFKDMDSDELYNLIIDNLTVDEDAITTLYKGKKKAEYLDSILHICPVCKKEHTIISNGNYVSCTSCGLKVEYKNDNSLSSNKKEFTFTRVHEWYDYQVEVLKKKEYMDDERIYQDKIEIYEPIMYQKKKYVGKGEMILYKNKFKFILEDKELILDFEDINIVTLLGRKKMNIYYKDVVYQVYNDRRTNLIKYMHVYYIEKNKIGGNSDGFIGI